MPSISSLTAKNANDVTTLLLSALVTQLYVSRAKPPLGAARGPPMAVPRPFGGIVMIRRTRGWRWVEMDFLRWKVDVQSVTSELALQKVLAGLLHCHSRSSALNKHFDTIHNYEHDTRTPHANDSHILK